MASRTVAGLFLKAFWDLGEDLWKDENDANLLKLSALCQLRVESRTTAITGVGVSSGGLDIYIVPEAEANELEIAVMDNGEWIYYEPEEGFMAYVKDENKFYYYSANMVWEEMVFGSAEDSGSGGGVSGGATSLDGLSDVDLTSETPAHGDYLRYNADNAQWEPVSANIVPFTTKTANYTATLDDAGTLVRMNLVSANDYTVPPEGDVAFELGTVLNVRQVGTGQTTIVAGSGVTINPPDGYSLNIVGQYSTVTLHKVDTNTWEVDGALEPLSA